MSDIERWTIRSAHDFTDHETGESYRLSCRVRGPEVRDGIEVVRASDYEGAVSDRDALLRYIHSNDHLQPAEGCPDCAAVLDALDLYRQSGALPLPRTDQTNTEAPDAR